MTTNNHPAHGPVSLDRLHQIREILSKASAQSDGGNLGYAMADAVKVIDGAIAAFDAEPVIIVGDDGADALSYRRLIQSIAPGTKLYTAPPAPVVPDEMPVHIGPREFGRPQAYVDGWNACRAAMLQGVGPVSNSDELPLDYLQGQKDGLEWAAQLAEANHPQTGDWLYDDPIELARAIRKGPDMPISQAGNSPVTPDTWIPVSERMPEAHEPIYIFHPDYGVDEGVWYDNQEEAFLWDSDCSRCRAIETVSHWMPMPALPAAPQPAVFVPSIKPDWMNNEFNAGWNSCRAAMLNHSENERDMVERVSQSYKLPEEKGASLQLRNLIRKRHAEWSDSTFGNVGPIGPLKHLSKEALEAAAEPDDLSEWADMQFLLWDAQRRAGISDGEITAAMEEKLKVNMARQWPEPKDGEPRLHIKAAPQQEVKS